MQHKLKSVYNSTELSEANFFQFHISTVSCSVLKLRITFKLFVLLFAAFIHGPLVVTGLTDCNAHIIWHIMTHTNSNKYIQQVNR